MLLYLFLRPIGQLGEICNPQDIRGIPPAPFAGEQFLKVHGSASCSCAAPKAANCVPKLAIRCAVLSSQAGRPENHKFALQGFFLATLTAMLGSQHLNGYGTFLPEFRHRFCCSCKRSRNICKIST